MSIYNRFGAPWKDRNLCDKGERYTDSLSPRSIANDNADVSFLSGDHTEASVDYNSLDLSEGSNQDRHQHPTTHNRHSTPSPPSSGDDAASADNSEDNQTSNNDSDNNDNVQYDDNDYYLLTSNNLTKPTMVWRLYTTLTILRKLSP